MQAKRKENLELQDSRLESIMILLKRLYRKIWYLKLWIAHHMVLFIKGSEI